MDAQNIKILGRNKLVEGILLAGLDVALPLHERGFDLIVYANAQTSKNEADTFAANPVQMCVAEGRTFVADRKFAHVPNLIHTFVWGIGSATSETYALTHAELVIMCDALGYTRTTSWQMGLFMTASPSNNLAEHIAAYHATPERWRQLVTGSTPIVTEAKRNWEIKRG